MDDVIIVVKDLQPAALIVVAVAVVALVANMVLPRIGPWAALLALGGVTAYVGNRVVDVTPRPAWLLPLAVAGLVMAVIAGFRTWTAIHATANNDRTIGYVFPTAIAVVALWLSIALIEFDASQVVSAVTR